MHLLLLFNFKIGDRYKLLFSFQTPIYCSNPFNGQMVVVPLNLYNERAPTIYFD